MRLLLLRHGATQGNELRQYVGGRTDEPLSQDGRRQCALAGVDEAVGVVYASPLRRAVESAKIRFPNAQIQLVDGLQEFDFGAFEGHSAQQMEHDAAYRSWVDGGCVGACPGGESRDAFIRRSNAALIRVLLEACDHGERDVVVMAHGGTIMAALYDLCDDEPRRDYFAWGVPPCGGYETRVRFTGWGVRLVCATKQQSRR